MISFEYDHHAIYKVSTQQIIKPDEMSEEAWLKFARELVAILNRMVE